MIPVPLASFGRSNTNGAVVFTGTRALFAMSSR